MSRYVMGDIHGELSAMEEVFKLSNFDFDNDELIQVGDICDRGLYSYECVELLKKVKNLVLIQGNHDMWFKDFLAGVHPGNQWLDQGGQATLESYHRHNVAPAVHKEFYDRQIPYYVVDNKCFVHAGWNPEFSLKQQAEHPQGPELLCWDRDFVNAAMSCSKGQKLKMVDKFDEVYIGHTPTIYWREDDLIKLNTGIIANLGKREVTVPILKGGITNVDTGSGKGGKLTIYNIDTKEYFQSQLQVKHTV